MLADLAPLPADPLGSPSAASPLGYTPQPAAGGNRYSGGVGSPFAPSASPNPYASPLAAYARGSFGDGNRRGLAWEQQPSFGTFWETVWEVICAPQDAFQTMRRRDGLGSPLGFIIISTVTTQIILLLEVLLLVVGLALMTGQGQNLDAVLIGFGLSAIGQIFGALISAAIGSFIGAVLLHVPLLMVGGADAGFQATYRVHAFGVGSVYLLLTIPIIGLLLFVPMYFVVLIIGLMHAHETSGLKAAFAVFVLPIVLTCCVCPVMLLLPPVLSLPFAQ
jgi:hypothetical protein